MNDFMVTIRLENIRPEGVIRVNGNDYENGSYIHCRIPQNSSLHVSLTYFGHSFYDQLYDPREDSTLLFRAPDATILTCAHDSWDNYSLNGTFIDLPFPVTVFDGAHFELTRRRPGESDVTISIKPTLGICDVTKLFDEANLPTNSTLSSTPADNIVKRLDGDKSETLMNADQFDQTKSVGIISSSLEVEHDNNQVNLDSDDSRASSGHGQQTSAYHTIRFQNVPAELSVYIDSNKIVNNEYKLDVRSSKSLRWYEVWHEKRRIGRFPLTATGQHSTLVTLPDFVWVSGPLDKEVYVRINGNVVTPPSWVPTSNSKSVYVHISSATNEVLFAENVEISDKVVALPHNFAGKIHRKPTSINNASQSGALLSAVPALVSLSSTVVGKVVLSLLSLFATMLYIRYSSGAPRIVPLALFVLMNALIWTSSSRDKPTPI